MDLIEMILFFFWMIVPSFTVLLLHHRAFRSRGRQKKAIYDDGSDKYSGEDSMAMTNFDFNITLLRSESTLSWVP